MIVALFIKLPQNFTSRIRIKNCEIHEELPIMYHAEILKISTYSLTQTTIPFEGVGWNPSKSQLIKLAIETPSFVFSQRGRHGHRSRQQKFAVKCTVLAAVDEEALSDQLTDLESFPRSSPRG